MLNTNKTADSDHNTLPLTDAEVESYTSNLLDAIQNGATLKDIHGLPDGTMDDVYRLAYEFYNQGKLNDAESLFRFLCIYDFYNAEYAIGLAAVYHSKKDYSKAIEFYALAYSLSKDDFRPIYYAGKCNLMLRHAVQAKKCFEIIIERCEEEILIKKSQAYLSALNDIETENA